MKVSAGFTGSPGFGAFPRPAATSPGLRSGRVGRYPATGSPGKFGLSRFAAEASLGWTLVVFRLTGGLGGFTVTVRVWARTFTTRVAAFAVSCPDLPNRFFPVGAKS